MIIGIGTDIIEISRMEEALASEDFMNKVYTETEKNRTFINTLSGYFAAKEAVSKALGTGFSKVRPNEIEIVNNPMGKPYVNLYGNAKERAKNLGVKIVHVSISHSKDMATAIAIAEK
ncbi:MAG: holo-ACP synthase [Firmicutes bacterium]|nr:holo-ACP synthase [Bacillota bacterium]